MNSKIVFNMRVGNMRIVVANDFSFVHRFYLFIQLVFFFFLASLQGLWDHSFPAGIHPVPLALKACSLNCWTAEKVPNLFYFILDFSFI